MEATISFLGFNVLMINKSPPFKGLSIRIPVMIPIKWRGFVNQGSGLPKGTNSLPVACCHALQRNMTQAVFLYHPQFL